MCFSSTIKKKNPHAAFLRPEPNLQCIKKGFFSFLAYYGHGFLCKKTEVKVQESLKQRGYVHSATLNLFLAALRPGFGRSPIVFYAYFASHFCCWITTIEAEKDVIEFQPFLQLHCCFLCTFERYMLIVFLYIYPSIFFPLIQDQFMWVPGSRREPKTVLPTSYSVEFYGDLGLEKIRIWFSQQVFHRPSGLLLVWNSRGDVPIRWSNLHIWFIYIWRRADSTTWLDLPTTLFGS